MPKSVNSLSYKKLKNDRIKRMFAERKTKLLFDIFSILKKNKKIINYSQFKEILTRKDRNSIIHLIFNYQKEIIGITITQSYFDKDLKEHKFLIRSTYIAKGYTDRGIFRTLIYKLLLDFSKTRKKSEFKISVISEDHAVNKMIQEIGNKLEKLSKKKAEKEKQKELKDTTQKKEKKEFNGFRNRKNNKIILLK